MSARAFADVLLGRRLRCEDCRHYATRVLECHHERASYGSGFYLAVVERKFYPGVKSCGESAVNFEPKVDD